MSVEKAIEARNQLLDEANAIEVAAEECLSEMTVPALNEAVGMLVGIRRLNKEIDETFDDLIATAHKAHKTATTRKKKFSVPLTAAEGIIKGKIKEYYAWESKQQSEEYSEKKAEARDAAATVRIAEVEGLREEGMLDQAEALASSPLAITPVPRPAATKAKGIALAETWKAVVEDEEELFKFILANPEWHHLISINMKELNTLARMQKDAMNMPGVYAESNRGVTIRLPAEE